MLQKLKQHWKVNNLDLILIIGTFAIGGSLCGIAGRKILQLAGMEVGIAWLVVYIILISLLWPFCVLLVSIPLGQYSFFKNYLNKIRSSLTGKKKAPVSAIAIFASGAGSNAQKIIDHFRGSSTVKVSLIVCNKEGAGVLLIAQKENIPVLLIDKERFFRGDAFVPALKEHAIDLVVLAGFLWKIPSALIKSYPDKIINIHPALLPKYGGKGMYGSHVHEAVIAANEKETGITIHYVDELYDHGRIIFQATCPVDPGDSAAMLAQKVHQLEHTHFPTVVDELLKNAKSQLKR